MFLMLLAIIILLALIAYLLQEIKDNMKQNKEVGKPKQFRREHSNMSRTNFRQYFKW